MFARAARMNGAYDAFGQTHLSCFFNVWHFIRNESASRWPARTRCDRDRKRHTLMKRMSTRDRSSGVAYTHLSDFFPYRVRSLVGMNAGTYANTMRTMIIEKENK